jgi:hypothetical protein
MTTQIKGGEVSCRKDTFSAVNDLAPNDDHGIVEDASKEEIIVNEGSEGETFYNDESQKRCISDSASIVYCIRSHPSLLSPHQPSHWTEATICGMQGKLSDPVIHYCNNVCCICRRYDHGRTDRGRMGVEAFFDTHHEY